MQPLVGNGYLSHAKGVRGDTMFVSGIFNGETTSPSHRAVIPATYAVQVRNSRPIGVLLDVRRGSYHRRGYIGDSSSWYELRWYAHRTERSMYVLELDVHNDAQEDLELVLNNGFKGFVSDDITFDQTRSLTPKLALRGPTKASTATTTCGKTKIPETPTGPVQEVCITVDSTPSTIKVEKDKAFARFSFLSTYRTNLDSPTDVLRASQDDYFRGKELLLASGEDLKKDTKLYELHQQGWQTLWQSGIEVSGRPDVAIAANASLFAILSSVRDDWAYGLAPGGLTNYYNGHSFWDTETWMYPPLLLLQPTIAESLSQYRFDRLDGARQKAASYSPPWQGTMFPWESAFSGVETCPTFAATGLREDHISGDIALALWQTYLVTHDQAWLKETALPMLQGIAEFWASRLVYDTDAETGVKTAHIKGVIPPDEYVDMVNDSVYTNYVAAEAFRAYVKANDVLQTTAQCSQCSTYLQMANDLVLLFDTTLNIHPEYASYPGNVVKQADVVLLHYPLNLEMTESVQRSDLEYYSQRTDPHGPAMTWGMHAIGFLDLNDIPQASKFFNMSFQDNMHAPFQVWTETPDGNAVNFITGAGGFLQTLLNGYAGLRIVEDNGGGLAAHPKCIEQATGMKVRGFHLAGSVLDLAFACDPTTGKVVTPSVELKVVQQGEKEKHRVEVSKVGAEGKFHISLKK